MNFNKIAKNYLLESPMGIGQDASNMYDSLNVYLNMILPSYKDYGIPIESIGDNLFKIEGPSNVYYWYEINGERLIIAELIKNDDYISIKSVGKKYKRTPPYADDFYERIINDRHRMGEQHIRFQGDESLSDHGLKLWKSLLSKYSIGVFDDESKQVIAKITNPEDMDDFIKFRDKSYRRYRYFIMENIKFIEFNSIFELHRYKYIAGIL